MIDRSADVNSIVHTFGVGFLAVDQSGKGLPSRSAGSGTLVDFLGIRGVLTAAHVAKALKTLPRVGIMRFRPGMSFDSLSCSGDELEVTAVGDPPYGEDGPDLAFIRLPHQIEARIAETNGFFNSLIRAREQAAGVERSPARFDFVTGVISEFSRLLGRVGSSTHVEHAVLSITGRLADVKVDDAGIDRITFQPFHTEKAPAPDSYEGLSGGGLWQMGDENDKKGRTLIGVVYYQSGKDEAGT